MSKSCISDAVTQERWQAAQAWERQHWVNTQKLRARFGKNLIWKLLNALGIVAKYRGDDWNQWWKAQFDNYHFLPASLENVLEVGCGPYTNVRLMLERCQFGHLFLSDPLIRTYVGFKLTLVSQMYKQAACTLDDHPLEELPFADKYFDLVVMINVLDHVFDARQCMVNVVRVVKPGGLLLIGQDLTNEEDLAALKEDAGAVGHPVRLDHEWFVPYLKNFNPVIDKILKREQGRSPRQHCGNFIFAGRKVD